MAPANANTQGFGWMKAVRLSRVSSSSNSSTRTSITTTTSSKANISTEKLAEEMKQQEKKQHEIVEKAEDNLKQLKKDVEHHRGNKTKEDIERLETAVKQLKEEEERLKEAHKKTIKELKEKIKIDQKTASINVTDKGAGSIQDDLKNWNALTHQKKLEVAKRDLEKSRKNLQDARNIFQIARKRYNEALKLNGKKPQNNNRQSKIKRKVVAKIHKKLKHAVKKADKKIQHDVKKEEKLKEKIEKLEDKVDKVENKIEDNGKSKKTEKEKKKLLKKIQATKKALAHAHQKTEVHQNLKEKIVEKKEKLETQATNLNLPTSPSVITKLENKKLENSQIGKWPQEAKQNLSLFKKVLKALIHEKRVIQRLKQNSKQNQVSHIERVHKIVKEIQENLKKEKMSHIDYDPVLKVLDAFKDAYKENHHALSKSGISKEEKAEISEKFKKAQNRAIDYLQIATLDITKRVLEQRMTLILNYGRYKESSRSTLFIKTRTKLQCAEQNLRKARQALGRTTEANAKKDIKQSIVHIALGYKILKAAIAELKSESKNSGIVKKQEGGKGKRF